jgi:hypothetical protein
MRRRAALIASAIVFATGIVYGGILVRQAGPGGVVAELHPNTVIFAVAVVLIAFLAAYGAVGRAPQARAVALWAGVPGLAVLGILAGFSIGVLLLIALVPTAVAGVSALGEAGVRRRVTLLASAGAALAWVGVGALLLWLPSVV